MGTDAMQMSEESWELTGAEELLLHQLLARQYWAGKLESTESEEMDRAKSLIGRLRFVKNQKRWGSYF